MDSEDVNNVVIGKVFSQESVPEKQLSGKSSLNGTAFLPMEWSQVKPP